MMKALLQNATRGNGDQHHRSGLSSVSGYAHHRVAHNVGAISTA